MDIKRNENTILTNQWVEEEIIRELEKTLIWIRIKTQIPKLMAAKAIFRGKLIAIILNIIAIILKKISNQKSNLPP